MKSFMPAVVAVLKKHQSKKILDAPCGGGWLSAMIDWNAAVDGIDLFDDSARGYQRIYKHDLDKGLPPGLGKYDAIASCEGIEHLGNPLLFLEHCRDHLNDNGVLIISTPNTWHPASRLKFFTRGFFPGFPSLGGKVARGTHMHIMPWSFPSLWLYMKLAGFSSIRLIDLDVPKPKYLIEKLLAIPQKFYCKRYLKKSRSQEEIDYWTHAGSDQSLYGRQLVVCAINSSAE